MPFKPVNGLDGDADPAIGLDLRAVRFAEEELATNALGDQRVKDTVRAGAARPPTGGVSDTSPVDVHESSRYTPHSVPAAVGLGRLNGASSRV